MWDDGRGTLFRESDKRFGLPTFPLPSAPSDECRCVVAAFQNSVCQMLDIDHYREMDRIVAHACDCRAMNHGVET